MKASFSHSLILSFSHFLILSFSHFLICSFSLLLILSFSACTGKEKKTEGWVAPEHEVVTRQMPKLQLTDSVKSSGHLYVYSILRTPCDSLDKVKDDMDDLYLDNTIRLTLRRDGAVFFDRTFTKATFAGSIDKAFYHNAILDGIRFLRAEEGQGLVFSFAVSYPDSDMSVPFIMTISEQGTFYFVKDENLDHDEDDPVYYDDGV